MQIRAYYTTMPDGTVKQINPFTGTEVWAVAGRTKRPITNERAPAAESLEVHSPEDYCSFCQVRAMEVAPEKARLVRRGDQWVRLDRVAPEALQESQAEFRRIGNLFEIVTLDYWRKNYAYRMAPSSVRWREEYLARPAGLQHIVDIVHYKLRQEGRTDAQLETMPVAEKLAVADSFFGGSHEQIIARRHFREDAKTSADLYSSGEMTPEEHYRYFAMTIEAMNEIVQANHYVRYVSVFQNWLRPAGASFDHLHKQLVALDEWGSSISSQIKMLRDDPNAFNDLTANFSMHHNLLFAENDYAIAVAGIGHRYPTLEVFSRSQSGRPQEHTPEEVRGMSDLVHAMHAAMGARISCNEEWYYTPVDAVYKMPWHVLIKWRVNVPAGFEGGTSIFINPMTPIELRDRMVPRLYGLRDERKVTWLRIAEECRVDPNPLKYYLR